MSSIKQIDQFNQINLINQFNKINLIKSTYLNHLLNKSFNLNQINQFDLSLFIWWGFPQGNPHLIRRIIPQTFLYYLFLSKRQLSYSYPDLQNQQQHQHATSKFLLQTSFPYPYLLKDTEIYT